MNNPTFRDDDLPAEDILWLTDKAQDLANGEKLFFCRTVKATLARGWCLLDARNYAFGRLLGVQSWSPSAIGR